jgi:hypothetical protein
MVISVLVTRLGFIQLSIIQIRATSIHAKGVRNAEVSTNLISPTQKVEANGNLVRVRESARTRLIA